MCKTIFSNTIKSPLYILLLVSLLPVFYSCKHTGEPPAVYQLLPPDRVSAVLDDSEESDGINGQEFSRVEWDTVDSAQNYIVYKKVGDSDFFPISRFTAGTRFFDYNPSSSEISYRIQSERDGEFSVLSGSSNTVRCSWVTLPPVDLKYELTGGYLKILWSAPDTLKTYRYQPYRKVGNNSWEKLGNQTPNTYYTDLTPPLGQDVYYGVKSFSDYQYSGMTTIGPIIVSSYISKPLADSFTLVNGIYVHWNPEATAGSYILYRDDGDPETPEIILYSGSNLDYSDYDIISGQFYYYKLGIMQNGTLRVSDYACGIGYHETKDLFEPNETQATAALLTEGLHSGSLYYFIDNKKNLLIDEDWYSVALPGHFAITLTFRDFENINNRELIFQEENKAALSLDAGDSFILSNNTSEEVSRYFRIAVASGVFEANKFGKYKIFVE